MNWHSIFLYEPSTGALFNKVKRNSRAQKGAIVGWINDSGYLVTTVKGRKLRVHRIIWEMHNEPIPDGYEIDHINRIRNDNRISNLRLATSHEQNLNLGHRRSDSGITGVVFNKKDQRWQAQIGHKGRHIYLGQYKEKKAAIKARIEAEAKYGFRRQA